MKDNDSDAGGQGELPEKMQSEAALLLAEIEETEENQPADDAPVNEPQAANQETTADLIAGLFFPTFNILIAPRYGAHWAMTEGECVVLGDAYGPLIDKYFPDFRTGPELAAVLVSIAVFGPRIGKNIMIAREAAKPDQATDESETENKPGADPLPVFADEPHENEA